MHTPHTRERRTLRARARAPGAARTRCRAACSLAAPPPEAAKLRAMLCAAAEGTQNGTAADAAQAAKVRECVRQLEELNPTAPTADVDLSGTSWRLVYTSSTGTSSGKVGPLVGEVTQVFDEAVSREDGRATYRNVVDWSGVVTVALLAAFDRLSDASLRVEFVNTTFSALGGLLSRCIEFPPGRVGVWRLSYVDEELRILYARGGSAKEENVFVMVRER